MIRVRLPLLGVAALLAAPAAFAQTPRLVVYPAGLHVIVVAPDLVADEPAEPSGLALVGAGDGFLISAEPAAPKDKKDAGRIQPTPLQTTEPPCSSCGEEVVEFEEFPSFCCLPYAAPPPPPPPSGHKCRFRHKSCNHGNCGQGYGNPYPGWSGGCAGGFCASPYGPPAQTCHRCQHKHHGAPNGPYPGYGYPCMSGCSMPWGYDCFNNDGCFGYCPPPYAQPQPQKCHGFLHKHKCSNDAPCPRCGYPSYSSPNGSWAYPVGGWSTPNDGYNGFMDPNCLPAKKHCHGLFHRCHSCKQAPPPCFNPYWQPQWQPCMNMGMDMDMAWDSVE